MPSTQPSVSRSAGRLTNALHTAFTAAPPLHAASSAAPPHRHRHLHLHPHLSRTSSAPTLVEPRHPKSRSSTDEHTDHALLSDVSLLPYCHSEPHPHAPAPSWRFGADLDPHRPRPDERLRLNQRAAAATAALSSRHPLPRPASHPAALPPQTPAAVPTQQRSARSLQLPRAQPFGQPLDPNRPALAEHARLDARRAP